MLAYTSKRSIIAVALHSFKMGFVPFICRCYMFLYIRLPFARWFSKVPNHTLFACQKKRDLGFHRYGIPSYFSFPKQSFIEPHTVISEVYFNNREFHPLFFWCHFLNLEYHSLSFGCHFRSHFDCHFGCHSEFSVHLFCLLFAIMSSILII